MPLPASVNSRFNFLVILLSVYQTIGRFRVSMPFNILIYEYALSLSSQQLDGWKEICLSVLMILKDLQLTVSLFLIGKPVIIVN